MNRLKTDYLYRFEGEYPKDTIIVLVTRTFPMSDQFTAKSVPNGRDWDFNLKQAEENWNITEIGHKEEKPEYFL